MAKTILVSAGHSESDPGAVGHGHTEQDLVTRLRDRIAQILKGYDCKVVEDGADGINEPLKRAIALARSANVAIEFHFNASANKTATGIEVLAKPKHRNLARKLAKAIHDATGLNLRGGGGGYKSDSSGQHPRLGFCEAGGLIVELCFISNKSDLNAYLNNFEEIARNLAEVLAAEVGTKSSVTPATSNPVKPTVEPPKETATAHTYTVKKGDTLSRILKAHGLAQQQFYKLNNLTPDTFDPDNIQIGEVFKVK